jgi:hypothetical protein
METKSRGATWREIAVNTLCAAALLAVFAPAVYLADRWIDCRIHHFVTNAPWHEPLEDWKR